MTQHDQERGHRMGQGREVQPPKSAPQRDGNAPPATTPRAPSSPIEVPGRPGVESEPNRDKAYGPGGAKPAAGSNRPDADKERRANARGVDADSPGDEADVDGAGGDFTRAPDRASDSKPML